GLELRPRAAVAAEEGAPAAEARLPEGPFIGLDDRPYRLGDVVVRLRDAGGLYDLNHADPATMRQLFRSFGLAGDSETLTQALFDYVHKPDDGGASRARDAAYPGAGLPLPRHAPLLTPWEPLRILGWQAREALWRRPLPFFEIVTPGPTGGLNLKKGQGASP